MVISVITNYHVFSHVTSNGHHVYLLFCVLCTTSSGYRPCRHCRRLVASGTWSDLKVFSSKC